MLTLIKWELLIMHVILNISEAGRNDFLRKLNYPYTKLEDENTGLPVIEVYAKYVSELSMMKCWQ